MIKRRENRPRRIRLEREAYDMFLLRNKEIKYLAIEILIASAVLVPLGFWISLWTGILVLITILLLCIIFYVNTRKRFEQIAKLADYLRRISNGEHSLDIRDNAEGELSILKSEIYKVTLMLSEYNEQLKKEKYLLANQMADISHQLKTPLTSMMVMVDLLKEDNLTKEKRQEFTSQIYMQLERIEWMVSSLLKMSKLDAGVVRMKQEKIPARLLIKNVLQPLLIPMELKEISCSVNQKEEVILCDIKWTTEALINILKNCIEHTPKGGKIQIDVKDNPLYSEIIITDNGAGISKEDLPHIFTRFYRGKNSSPDSVGIGLAMSYSILRRQQGDIRVNSKIGKGSSFAIHLYKSVM